jgi:tetratricopeptide (TPR) repeat protein
MDRARTAYSQGQEFFDAGDYEAALLAFRESLEAFPHFKTLFNIGLCEERLGRLEQAIDMYGRYVDWPTDVPHRDEVVEKIAELKARLASEPPVSEFPVLPEPPVVLDSSSPASSEIEKAAIEVRSAQNERRGLGKDLNLAAVGITSLCAGGVFVITGAGLLGAAASKAQRIRDINASPEIYRASRDKDLAEQGRRLETAGWVLGGVGLGLATAGALLVLLRQKGRTNSVETSLGVLPDPSGAAAVASWRF